MSELEARKYTSIRMLREEIRQDMRDYQMICSDDHEGDAYFSPVVMEYRWFCDYLKQKIQDNLNKLKELGE